jgi:hypothetical protein
MVPIKDQPVGSDQYRVQRFSPISSDHLPILFAAIRIVVGLLVTQPINGPKFGPSCH